MQQTTSMLCLKMLQTGCKLHLGVHFAINAEKLVLSHKSMQQLLFLCYTTHVRISLCTLCHVMLCYASSIYVALQLHNFFLSPYKPLRALWPLSVLIFGCLNGKYGEFLENVENLFLCPIEAAAI